MSEFFEGTSRSEFYYDGGKKLMDKAFYDELREENQWDRYKTYLNSRDWAELKTRRLEFDNFECQICGNRKQLEVHHLIYPHLYGQEHLSDLITVCKECHSILEELKKGQTAEVKKIYRVSMLVKFYVEELGDFYKIRDELSRTWKMQTEHSYSGIWLELCTTNVLETKYFKLEGVFAIKYIQDTYGLRGGVKIERTILRW